MAKTWVVYRRPMKDDPVGPFCVCTGAEWAAMDRAAPGLLALVWAGISTEREAERLARGAAAAGPGSGRAARPRASRPHSR